MEGVTKKMTILLFALVILSGGAAFYFYRQYAALASNPQVEAQREAADLVAQVSKIFLLPEGETPTIATVLDPAGLKGQTFFANALKGDKVLIYANAREAILYDPAAHKIINIAPLMIGNSQTDNPSAVSPAAPSVTAAQATSTQGNSTPSSSKP